MGYESVYLTDDSAVTDPILTSFVCLCLKGFTVRSREVNYQKLCHVAVSTIRTYLRAINTYYKEVALRKLVRVPYDSSDKDAHYNLLLAEQEKYEKEAARRARLPDKVRASLCERSGASSPLGLVRAVHLWVELGCHGGFRAQEYAQDSPTTPRYYVRPNGLRVHRAFTMDDFIFYCKDQLRSGMLPPPGRRQFLTTLGLLYKIQKNRRNGQIIRFTRNLRFPRFCPVRIAMELVDLASACGQGPADPLGVFRDDRGRTRFVTGAMVTDLLRSITSTVFPAISPEELALISTHSIRVTAAVLLHEAGKDGPYIKLRLRWNSNCFELYLRNSDIIVAQHNDALTDVHERLESMLAPFRASLDPGQDTLPDIDIDVVPGLDDEDD